MFNKYYLKLVHNLKSLQRYLRITYDEIKIKINTVNDNK
jgi:hypothetical protein